MRKKGVVKPFIIFLFIILAYLPTLAWMVSRWVAPETYYGHGFLVPIISLFIIFRKRKELSQLKINPSGAGWFFFLAGIIIHIISALLNIYFSSGFSLILALIGVVLLFLGRDYLKRLLFPLLFLVFMIPLPLVLISNLTFKLKIFASQAATTTLNTIGIWAVREGSIIQTNHSFIVLEDPCSGMGSLIAFIALGALMAYFSSSNSKLKKAVLFTASFPIAVSSNIIRILLLSIASEIYGQKLTTGIFHDIAGILVFIFTFLGLLILEKILG